VAAGDGPHAEHGRGAVRGALRGDLALDRPAGGRGHLRVEGTLFAASTSWEVFGEGETDPWALCLARARRTLPAREPRRPPIVVEKDGDTLVLDPARPPELYADNQWSVDRTSWLQWAVEPLAGRGAQPETLAHIFTERPVYRPEEEVHIKGYLRVRKEGHLSPLSDLAGFVVVEGPGDLAWRYPVTTSPLGTFYHRFQEKDLPPAPSRPLRDAARGPLRPGAFRVEAYRVPRFEVRLHGPRRGRSTRRSRSR